MKIISLTILLTGLFLSACADPAANKPKAETAKPSASTTTDSGALKADLLTGFKAAGTELTVLSDTSKIEFTGSKVTGKHDGGFKTFKGLVDLVENDPAKSKVLFEIEMASVFSDSDGLTEHLQTGDFFDVKEFPKSAFISTKIETIGGGAFNITGDLEMRGVKKSITFPATIVITSIGAVVKSEFAFNRKDFGIAYAGKADDLIREDVVLKLDLNATNLNALKKK